MVAHRIDLRPPYYYKFKKSTDSDYPIEGIFPVAVLDGLQLGVQPGREFAGLAVVDDIMLFLVE